MNQKEIKSFQNIVWDFYRNHKRDLPWRRTSDPYCITVSEIMLQQTQVNRVIEKYTNFITAFPTFQALATAPTVEVVKAWQGLGYNRRALSLIRLSQIVVHDYSGNLPTDPAALNELPGIGKATAQSIAAFAFNYPAVFIETNIRRVYIHHFFSSQAEVDDKEILSLVSSTLPKSQAREWYWALMDYGTQLSKTVENPNRKSRQYVRQSPFDGSTRQLRGNLLSLLVKQSMLESVLSETLKKDIDTIKSTLQTLQKEGFVDHKKDQWFVKN